MRKAELVPYALERPNVQCSGAIAKTATLATQKPETTTQEVKTTATTTTTKTGTTTTTLATLQSHQPSLRACAEHVYATHGKAYFLYGNSANETDTVTHQDVVDTQVGDAFDNYNDTDGADFAGLLDDFKDFWDSNSTEVLPDDLEDLTLLVQEASGRRGGKGRASQKNTTKTNKFNCVVLEKFDSCSTDTTKAAAWNLYEAHGVPSLCGDEPPGYKEYKAKPACSSENYQVKDGYPGSACVPCFKGCPSGSYNKGCGGTSQGKCTQCPTHCPAEHYLVGCKGLSAGKCQKCPTPSGPFKSFVKNIVPCKFSCYAPSEPHGQSCTVRTPAKIVGRTNKTLSFGKCDSSHWKSQVVTSEAHCGDKFSTFKLKLEWIGKGSDGKGQWHISDASTESTLSIVNKTLVYEGQGKDVFTFVPVISKAFKIMVSGTNKCLKSQQKPGYQLSDCCCDLFELS